RSTAIARIGHRRGRGQPAERARTGVSGRIGGRCARALDLAGRIGSAPRHGGFVLKIVPRYCVLIPCLNEERAIGPLLRAVLTQCSEVIVVDDGSDDRTPEIASALPVTLLRHTSRRGKGEALRTGFREALKRGFDAVLTMDGD